MMKVRIKNRFILLLFGWGKFPSYVVADTSLWRLWLRRPHC